MPHKLLSFLLAVIILVNARAQDASPLSLFHTPEYLEDIKNQRKRLPRASEKTPHVPSLTRIRLDGLMYLGPTSWRLWINGKPYDKKAFPNLSVVRVTATHATFSWEERGGTRTFTLAPSHSYPDKKAPHD
ncbi:MAG: hypothetical protein H2057_05940 [Alphaproteobacteria bacterium]|nr:hypothetical protein [Alphaproteobacteria bacterium]